MYIITHIYIYIHIICNGILTYIYIYNDYQYGDIMDKLMDIMG